ncbi:MAG: hypothetical protein NXI10_12265 [bacterium]|nr:hypothetical protein [bacterium]
MKQIFVALLIMSCPLFTSAQYDTVFVKYMHAHGDGESYFYDTLFTDMPNENHILVGTTKLPGTQTQYSSYPYGLYFSDFTGSDCKSHSESKAYGPDQILDVESTDSTFINHCQIGANCCYDFLGDMEVSEDGILDLKYYGYGDYCACNCCFGLTYTFQKENLYGDEKKELVGITINGESATMYKLE